MKSYQAANNGQTSMQVSKAPRVQNYATHLVQKYDETVHHPNPTAQLRAKHP